MRGPPLGVRRSAPKPGRAVRMRWRSSGHRAAAWPLRQMAGARPISSMSRTRPAQSRTRPVHELRADRARPAHVPRAALRSLRAAARIFACSRALLTGGRRPCSLGRARSGSQRVAAAMRARRCASLQQATRQPQPSSYRRSSAASASTRARPLPIGLGPGPGPKSAEILSGPDRPDPRAGRTGPPCRPAGSRRPGPGLGTGDDKDSDKQARFRTVSSSDRLGTARLRPDPGRRESGVAVLQ